MSEEKRCKKCEENKPLPEFGDNKRASDGKKTYCKKCEARNYREKYHSDKDLRHKKLEYLRTKYATKRRELNRRRYYRKREEIIEKRKKANSPEKRCAANKKHALKHPEKYKARNFVGYALKKGTLKKCPCMICRAENVEAHHPDYSKPLEVMWLCRPHHRAWERVCA